MYKNNNVFQSPEIMSSRLIIKNLPKKATEDRIKEYFSLKGQITDVKLVKDKNGISRRFAYVGFKDSEHAKAALQYFNKSYFDTSKIIVEFATNSIKEKVEPKALDENEKKNFIATLNQEKNNSELKEFLDVMKTRTQTKTWINEELSHVIETKNSLSDLAYLKSKMVESIEESAGEQIDVLDTGRLFVTNLPYSCTATDLEECFKNFGELTETHIVLHKETKRSKGYGFVQFMLPEHAKIALEKLNGTVFQGRLIKIMAAKEPLLKKVYPGQLNPTKTSWDNLFLNTDAVLDATAQELNLNKSDLLNPETENMATKLALAETHIIAQTRTYLTENGICLDTKNSEKSKTTILVKNLPYNTDLSELQRLFKKFGVLNRVLIPPTKAIAIVEFILEQDAKNAFNRLAYSRFKDSPLYLEWAPVGMLLQKEQVKTSVKVQDKIEEEEQQENSTLFVKNLSFNTTESDLRDLFECDALRSVKISQKPNPKKKGSYMSMGFGFLEFSSVEAARNALEKMQHVVLDGHELSLKLAHISTSSTVGIAKRSKLIVKNVPFEATRTEIFDLFKVFGNIRRVRLPGKANGSHRGFAFVEFSSKSEAKRAKESLSSTHLYGRHLILEYAKDEDHNLEELRKKAGQNLRSRQVDKRSINEILEEDLGNDE